MRRCATINEGKRFELIDEHWQAKVVDASNSDPQPQMIVWRTLAETHSLTTTVAMMIRRMSDT
jgi:hypothetical protein